MKYFKLNIFGTAWIPCKRLGYERTIALYDDNLEFKGIGLY